MRHASWGFLFDSLTLIMLISVTAVSCMVHLVCSGGTVQGAWGVCCGRCMHGMSVAQGTREVLWAEGPRLAGTQGISRAMEGNRSIVGKHRTGRGD